MVHSLLNLILNLIHSDGAAPVGWCAGQAVGRAEFVARIKAWHQRLKAQHRTPLAHNLTDRIEFAAALFGAWYAGKTVWLSADTLPASVQALEAKVDGFIGEFPASCSALSPPPLQEMTGNAALMPSEPLVPLGPFLPLRPDFAGLVVHTSGSTGSAEAIPKKLRQLFAEVDTLEHLFGAQMGDADIIATVSHQHIYGLLFKILWPLAAGRALHADTIQYPEQLVDRLQDRILISSPAHLKRLPSNLNWPRCRLLFCSGGVLPVESAMACRTLLGQTPLEVYGSSETGGIAWRQRADDSDDGWLAMPGVQWRITETESLEVRSPHLLNDDWMTLSDRAAALADGKFLLKGRGDRLVKIEEKRISLDALEQALRVSPLVSEARVIMMETRQRQHLAAVIVLSEAGQRHLQEQGKLALNRYFKAALQEIVELVAVPRRWRYVDAMPCNPQGKNTQAMLLALFEQTGFEQTEFEHEPDYKLLQRSAHNGAQQAELDVHWPRSLQCFNGHFDNAPVLPGVAQVDWAIRLGRQLFDIPKSFRAMHGLKFQQVVLPEDTTRLTLNYDADKACLSFKFTSEARQHSSGRILFRQGAGDD